MNKKKLLLEKLSDGKFYSGARLAGELGVSRTAIWKQIESLSGYGLDIYRVRGKGYCLARPLELFDIERIRSVLEPAVKEELGSTEVFFTTNSTNQQLMDRIGVSGFHCSVVLAEYQTAGRGRRGRQWLSPLGAGICFSIGWHFDSQPETITALSLAAGVSIVQTLHEYGIDQARLKWPNDLFCEGNKLGGILVETRSEMAGPCDIVLGIGINFSLPDSVGGSIPQPVTDVSSQLGQLPSRNLLAGALINSTVQMLKEFRAHGFTPFRELWRRFDCFSGKQATLSMPDRTVTGKVLGISGSGLLCMSIAGAVHEFASGDLNLRIKP